ncbi:MAG: hypothetical protein HKO94_04885, partial [Flavobacteriaceae bacterium]|nr:hypothetical protein [Flavobacteriaceae bacterium]
MKNYLLFILLVITTLCYPQQKSITIKWNGSQTLSTESASVVVPSFEKDAFNFSFEEGLRYSTIWKTNGRIDENSVSVSNLVTRAISETELYQLNRNIIPSGIELKLRNSSARGDNYLSVEFHPIIKDNGVFKRVESLSISYNRSNQPVLRTTTAIMNSVLDQGEWHKFYV